MVYFDVSRVFSEVLGGLSDVRRCTSMSPERFQKYFDLLTSTPLGRSQMYFDVSRAFSEVLGGRSDVRRCTSTSHERSQKYFGASRTLADVLWRVTSVLRSTWTPLRHLKMYFNISQAFSEVLGRLWNVLNQMSDHHNFFCFNRKKICHMIDFIFLKENECEIYMCLASLPEGIL